MGEYRLTKLRNHAWKIGSGVTPRGGTSVYLNSGIPLIRSQNVLSGRLDLSSVVYIDETVHKKMMKSAVRGSDVLLNITGASIGRSCVTPNTVESANVNQHVCVIRTKATLDPYYLSAYLNSYGGQKQIWSFQSGGSREGLNYDQIGNFLVPLPPLSKQKKISEILRTWEEAIEKLEALRTEKEQLLRRFYSVVFKPGSPINRFWAEYRIGEFLIPRVEYALPKASLPLYSLTIEEGVTPKTERYNRGFLVKDQNSKTYKIVHPGDVVFNPSNLRWGAIARSNVNHKVLLSPIYEVLEVSSDSINADYLTQALTCPFQIRRFATKVEGTLLERMAVKLNAFLMSKIVVPKDMKEQADFSNLLNSMQEEIRFLSEQISSVVLQKSGLLQKLLTGNGRLDSIDTRLPVKR